MSHATPRERIVAAAELLLASLVVVGHNVWQVLPNEVPVLLAAGWISLRLRGRGWGSVGLARPESWARAWLWAAALAASLQVFGLLVLDPLLTRSFGQTSDLSSFRPLVGNPGLALVALVVIWTLAAFGEELVYRGYLMNRAADVGDRSRPAWAFSLLVVVLLFGVGHFYKGVPGMIDSASSALVLGVAYLASGRNLWLPILTHGLVDTIGLVIVYLGLAPGL